MPGTRRRGPAYRNGSPGRSCGRSCRPAARALRRPRRPARRSLFDRRNDALTPETVKRQGHRIG